MNKEWIKYIYNISFYNIFIHQILIWKNIYDISSIWIRYEDIIDGRYLVPYLNYIIGQKPPAKISSNRRLDILFAKRKPGENVPGVQYSSHDIVLQYSYNLQYCTQHCQNLGKK